MRRQGRRANRENCTTLVGGGDSVGSCASEQQGTDGNSLYFPLDFYGNRKLLSKVKSVNDLKKNTRSKARRSKHSVDFSKTIPTLVPSF